MYKWRKLVVALLLMCQIVALGGCTMLSEERVKLNDLGFTVLSEEVIPEELKTIIDEKKAEPFKLTYSDEAYLYIVIGYGQQATGGYSIAVNELYLAEESIYVNTTLLGPEKKEVGNNAPSCPYIVLKTDFIDKPVVFE